MNEEQSILWQQLPFNAMLRTVEGRKSDRSFIEPDTFCYDFLNKTAGKCKRHKIIFYANAGTLLTIVVDIGSDDDLIAYSHYLYEDDTTGEVTMSGKAFNRSEGVDEWDRYCKDIFQILHKQFLL